MRRLLFLLTTITIFIVTLTSFTPPDDTRKNQILLTLIFQGLSTAHYSPVNIDDEFSKRAYDLYLTNIDAGKRFLTFADVKQLENYKTLLDEQVKNADFTFFEISNNILVNRVREVKPLYQEILSNPFDFSTDESIQLDPDKIPFARDDKELKEYWRKYLKYQTLTRINNIMDLKDKDEESTDTSLAGKSFEQIEAKARKRVKNSFDEWFNRMEKVEREDRLAIYINSLVSAFDPHTNYYPPKDKEDFDIQMSGRLEGIGATLQEKNGYIKVVRIVPGSASWKQGELEVGDLILKVAQGEEEPVDVVDMRLDHAVKLIRGKKGTEVRLTVRKLDGTLLVIPIIRDVVIIEETYAKSAILKANNGDNVGYIDLPKFYADFTNSGGRSSGEDMKKEITRLKSAGVKGIIIDLRNNGGGSLQDVVEMAGLFVDKGPVVQVKGQGEPYVYDDKDTKVIYSGPLAIMVNSMSASASEILAAAIQDYNRGVIIGSKNTFGKGTVQRFVDLDRFLSVEYNELKPLGSLKLTVQKFFRINGGSTQLKGVEPDIILPDVYHFMEFGEKELDYPMPWTEIDPVDYKKWDLSFDLDKVKRKSKNRLEKDETFQLVLENAERLKMQSENTTYTLNYDKFHKEQELRKEENKKYKDINRKIPELSVDFVNYKSPESRADTTREATIKDWHKNITKDPYVFEAVNIMYDMIKN